jgi:hypothetical protein
MNEPRDKDLYEKVRKKIYIKYPKHSAYRSGLLVKEYKDEYMKKYKNDNAYIGTKKKNEGLNRWFAEEWKNQRGEVGYKNKSDVYRPTKRITDKTPKTFKELSKNEITKAMKEKKKTGRVREF